MKLMNGFSCIRKGTLIQTLKPRSIMLLFSGVYFVSYLTRINYAAVISAIIADEKINASYAAVAVTGAFVTYGAGQLVSGWLSDRVQPSRLVAAALIVTSVVNLSVPFCSAWVRNAVWCINGAAQAFIWSPLVRMVPELLDEEYQLKAGVRISWGGHFGNIAVYLIAPLFIRLSGWKSIFLFSAFAGFITAAIWLVLCGGLNTRLNVKSNEREKSGKAVNCTAAAFVFIIAAIIIQGSLRDGVTTWMPSYISETFSLGSDISVLSGVVMPIFAFLCIWGTEYLYYGIKDVQKCCLIYFSAALAAALLIPAATKTGPALTVIAASVLVGSMHGINILQTCMLPRQIGDNNRIGLISGIFNGSVYIGSALSTYGFALVSDIFGWNGTVLVWSVFSALGVLICLILTRLCKR